MKTYFENDPDKQEILRDREDICNGCVRSNNTCCYWDRAKERCILDDDNNN